VKSALHEIWQAPTKDEANKAFDRKHPTRTVLQTR
jgi:hypothetical protein